MDFQRTDPAEEAVVKFPTPSRETMEARWDFQASIRRQTLQHRRIHRHGGLGTTGRNIAFSLRDRELLGVQHVVLHGPKRKRPEEQPDLAAVVAVSEEKDMNGLGPHDEEDEQPNDVRVCYPTRLHREIRVLAEYHSVVRYHSAFLRHLGGEDELDEEGRAPSSSRAISTISIAFSPDAATMASTHGDHTVKITCCATGSLLQTLEGHPRTPWTVKYHPIKSNIVASGCLGFQVRVWDWKERICLQMIRLDFAIISLSFHPTGHILAVASGPKLHFWDYDNYGGRETNGSSMRGAITEVEQRHMLRCVHFPPDGNTIIVGGMNPSQEDPRRTARERGGMSGGGINFYLRLWDFDFQSALHPSSDSDERHSRGTVRLYRKPLSNVSTACGCMLFLLHKDRLSLLSLAVLAPNCSTSCAAVQRRRV